MGLRTVFNTVQHAVFNQYIINTGTNVAKPLARQPKVWHPQRCDLDLAINSKVSEYRQGVVIFHDSLRLILKSPFGNV